MNQTNASVSNRPTKPRRRFQKPVSPVSSAITGDFVSEYEDYGNVYELDRKIHRWAAIQTIASVLNKNGVFIPWGGLKYSLDLWMLMLSESGGGRNTATNVTRTVLQKAGLSDLIYTADWGSRPALSQQFQENPAGLFVWPEWSIVHKKLNDPKFGGAKEWITNCFDEWSPPDSVKYRSTGKSSDTPEITFDRPLRINIWATSSVDWFTANLGDGTDITGGFLARYIIEMLPRSEKAIPRPPALDAATCALLAEKLKGISKLSGEVLISPEAKKLYDDWYCAASSRFGHHHNGSLAKPFFNRLKGHVVKLAVVFQVSETCSLTVSEKAMQRAIDSALELEKTIYKLLESGMTKESAELSKMEELVRKTGAVGISKSDLTTAFKHWKTRDREDRLRTLLESVTILPLGVKTTGRSKTMYVHRDHWQGAQ